MSTPIKKLFLPTGDPNVSAFTYDFSVVKEAFIFAGAKDVADTEDSLGGFTCKFGDIPFYVKKYSALTNNINLSIKIGDAQNFYINLNEIIGARALVVYKGSTGVAIKLYDTYSNQRLICIDNILNRVYVTSQTSNYGYSVVGYKDADGITTRELKNISASTGDNNMPGAISGGIPGDVYTKSKLIRKTWFGENTANAPTVIIPAIDVAGMEIGGIAQFDSVYYIYLGSSVSYNTSIGEASFYNSTKNGIVFPLGA